MYGVVACVRAVSRYVHCGCMSIVVVAFALTCLLALLSFLLLRPFVSVNFVSTIFIYGQELVVVGVSVSVGVGVGVLYVVVGGGCHVEGSIGTLRTLDAVY